MENTTPALQAHWPKTERSPFNQRNFVLTALKILVSTALIYWILRDTNLQTIWAAIRTADPVLLALAASLHLIGFVLSAYRWRLLLRTQGADAPIPFLVKSYIISMFFNNFLPSTIGGDAMRAYDSWRIGHTKAGAIAVVFVDRFLGLVALMLFAWGALLVADELVAGIPLISLWVVLITGGMLVLTWLIFMPSTRIAVFIANIHLPVFKPLQRLIDAFLAFQGRKDALVQAMVLSLLLQGNVVLHYYLIAKAMGLPIPLMSFFLIIPLVTLMMMLPVSINAIGIRENAFIFFFGAFGILSPEAVAFAWIAYGLVLVQGMLGGILYALRK